MNYIVEHRVNGHYVMDTITGVEDIDVDQFKSVIGIWVCETMEETRIMEKELKEMRHARSGQPS